MNLKKLFVYLSGLLSISISISAASSLPVSYDRSSDKAEQRLIEVLVFGGFYDRDNATIYVDQLSLQERQDLLDTLLELMAGQTEFKMASPPPILG